MLQESQMGMSGTLEIKHIKAKNHRARSIRLPKIGRVIFTDDPGDSLRLAQEYFQTNLFAVHRDGDGKIKTERDLGSGLVTNVGVLAMAFDWTTPQNCQILKLANFHAVGTGTTVAAATDIVVKTLASPTTVNAVEGAQSSESAANAQKYKSTATISFTGSAAITEWGLHSKEGLSATTGSPFTGTSANTGTATGTPYTASSASVRGQVNNIVYSAEKEAYLFVKENSTSAFTGPGHWYKKTDGTIGETPGTTSTFTILPVMWDHKVFGAFNVENGDSLQFVYGLLINAGG